jgi:hypothetical protein
VTNNSHGCYNANNSEAECFVVRHGVELTTLSEW